MTDPLLVTEAVTRRYGYRRVFGDVTFSLRRGEVFALLGPNGAGKTTLLRVLAGLLRPSGGSVTRNGTVGLVAHHSMAYDALTARENLVFAAKLWGGGSRTRRGWRNSWVAWDWSGGRINEWPPSAAA